jgi:UDP:flavonoid glycosyltransferase YjiC (YdhE family)/LPS sulfotransferase NodH
MLGRIGSVPIPTAWFDPMRVPRLSHALSVPLGAPDWAARYLSDAVSRATTNGTCAVSLNWAHLRWLLEMERVAAGGRQSDEGDGLRDVERLANRFPGARYVFVSSHDTARQALRRWAPRTAALGEEEETSGAGEGPGDAVLPDLQEVRWLETIIERQNRAWEVFFAIHGILPDRVTYEDLKAKPSETLQSLIISLGLGPTSGPEPLSREDAEDVLVSEWLAQYRSVRPRLRATVGVRGSYSAARSAAEKASLRTVEPVDRPLRVLMSVRPYRGHVHPMIPLARAVASRGHGVAIATEEDMGDVVAPTRIAWLPAGMNPGHVHELSDRTDPDYGYLPVRAKVDDLLEIAVGEFHPDVIIRDPTDLAPMIVGEVLGALNVIYGLSRFIPLESWRILRADRTIKRLRRDFWLPPDPGLKRMFTDLYLAVIPPDLEIVDPLPVPAVQRMRYVPWDGGTALAASSPPSQPGSRPLVLVTLGTVYNFESGVFIRLLQAMEGEEVDVICTLGDGVEDEVLEAAPTNVRFERYLPHSQILPRCSAVLCHGGFNTVLGALCAGVPVVCVPLGSDQDFNAAICEREGFGLAIDREEATVERLRNAVHTVLEDPSFADKTKSFRSALDDAPSLDEAVQGIERAVAERRG